MGRAAWGSALIVVFVAGIAIQQTFPIQNHDLFWHLRLGDEMIERGGLLDADPLTFNAEGKTWIQHEWGAQLVLAKVSHVGGWWGLRLLRGLLAGLTLAFIALAFRRRAFGEKYLRPTLLLMGLLLTWVLLEPFSSLRPHLFGWVFLGSGYLFFLATPPPFRWPRFVGFAAWMVVWVNVHSSALIVPALCALFTLELLFEMARTGKWKRPLLLHWLALCATSSVAILLQPSGWHLLGYALQTRAFNAESSHEWLPLLRADLWRDKPHLITLFGLLVVLVGVAAIRRLRRGEVHACFPGLLPALAVIVMALSTRRMLFLAYLPVHLLLFEVQGLLDAHPLPKSSVLRRPWLRPVAGALAVALVLGWSFERRSGPLDPRPFPPGFVPLEAIDFLRSTGLSGRMSNIDYWGGFLAYFLEPGQKVFIDGRWPMVGQQVFEDQLAIQGHTDQMETLCDRYGIDYLIQPADTWKQVPPPDAKRWVLAYRDERAVIALRRGERFEENARRVCTFYRDRPEARLHARSHASQAPSCRDGPCERLPWLTDCCCPP